MVQIVEKKLQNLQYTHEKEIEKERNIVAMLQQNLKEQKEAFMKQMSDRQAGMDSFGRESRRDLSSSEREELAQLKAKVDNLTQINRQIITENEKLKKSKGNLESQIVLLSDQIVQMSN